MESLDSTSAQGRLLDSNGNPVLYFKSTIDDPLDGVDLANVSALPATYFYLNASFKVFCKERLSLDLPTPCWVQQEQISRQLFGSSGVQTLRKIEKEMGTSLFAPEFANVHSTFEWTEPELRIDGECYTVGGPEAYFQGQKSVSTSDEAKVKQLILTATPEDAFSIGRTHAMRSDWEKVKYSIMYSAVYAKFSQHDALKQLLLSTGTLPLNQIKPRDSYWGSGPDGKGRNALGTILAQVREDLRKDSSLATPK